jgi:hypothetical protein
MKNEIKEIRLDMLVNHNSPYAIFEEVKNNFIHHYPVKEFILLRAVFNDLIDLMEGRYPGYQRCTSKFHDLQHVSETLLAFSRLIDGYNIKNPSKKFSLKKVKLALIATIFHDVGYLKKIEDEKKFTTKYDVSTQIERSIEFLSKYIEERGFSYDEIETAKNILKTSGADTELSEIGFKDKEEKLLGIMLATSDYLAQMSSRTYLEKLIYLYFEFEEGGKEKSGTEFNLLKKTLEFYKVINDLFEKEYGGVYKFAKYHFQKCYGIDENLYIKTIERTIKYLEAIKYYKEIKKKLRRRI